MSRMAAVKKKKTGNPASRKFPLWTIIYILGQTCVAIIWS